MRWLLIATVLALSSAAATAAAATEPPDPCVLITASDASTVFSATPAKPKTKKVGATRSCTYVVKKKTMTVATSRVATQASFDKAVKKTGLAIQIQGVGVDAYSVSFGKGLLVWKSGIEISFTFVGVEPLVATQQTLVKTAAGRL